MQAGVTSRNCRGPNLKVKMRFRKGNSVSIPRHPSKTDDRSLSNAHLQPGHNAEVRVKCVVRFSTMFEFESSRGPVGRAEV